MTPVSPVPTLMYYDCTTAALKLQYSWPKISHYLCLAYINSRCASHTPSMITATGALL